MTTDFTHLSLDIATLFREHPIEKKSSEKPITSFYHRVYRSGWIPLRYRVQLMRIFKQTQADLGWFFEFRDYWQQILGGRPLWSIHDFYFVKNMLRLRATQLAVADQADAYTHLETWQQPDAVHQLLHSLTKENDEVGIRGIFAALAHIQGKPAALLEFGCATASYTQYYLEFFDPQAKAYIADIQTAAFHYAAYRFRKHPNVTAIPLLPEKDFALELPTKVDVILCMAVFEHLNHPLMTIQAFHEHLNQGGILIFDYLIGEGKGLDTIQGVEQRAAVLDFIERHFTVRFGRIDKQHSMGTTVIYKR